MHTVPAKSHQVKLGTVLSQDPTKSLGQRSTTYLLPFSTSLAVGTTERFVVGKSNSDLMIDKLRAILDRTKSQAAQSQLSVMTTVHKSRFTHNKLQSNVRSGRLVNPYSLTDIMRVFRV